MSGASWPAAAWKPREAKEGAACRESVSWADGAKRVRRCFLTQKSGLPLPSDHSLDGSCEYEIKSGGTCNGPRNAKSGVDDSGKN